jgi:uncharacterized membrane protein
VSPKPDSTGQTVDPAAPAGSTGEPPPTSALPPAADTVAKKPPDEPDADKKKPNGKKAPLWVVMGAVMWLSLLTAAFVVYVVPTPVRDALPRTIGSQIPITVPWFGALGGCLISLSGIVDHGVKDWKRQYNYWHPFRPILGAIMGGIGCVLLLVTTEVSTTGTVHTDAAFYDGVAFVLGYAEASFRSLITNVTNVILKLGDTNSGNA